MLDVCQTKATSSAAIPTASPLSIDLPLAQFLCDLWPCVIPIRVHTEALSQQDNGLVVTEHGDGRVLASLPPQVQTHDSSDSECLPVTSARPKPPPPSSFPLTTPCRPVRSVRGFRKQDLAGFIKTKTRTRSLIYFFTFYRILYRVCLHSEKSTAF